MNIGDQEAMERHARIRAMEQAESAKHASPAAMRIARALFPHMQPRDDAKILATAAIIDREIAHPETKEGFLMISIATHEALQMLAAGWTATYDPGLDAVLWRSPDKKEGACSHSLDNPPQILVDHARAAGDITNSPRVPHKEKP